MSQPARVKLEYYSASARRWPVRRTLIAAGVIALLASCWHFAEVRPATLFDSTTLASVWHFIRGLFPPDLSVQFLKIVIIASLQTVATALAGTILSVLFGLSLGFVATPVLWEQGVLLAGEPPGIGRFLRTNLSRLTRALLGFLRAVPDLVWALVFVVAVGLGPLAGTLALAVSYTGTLGRVYAHLFEDIDPRPLEALHSAGATRAQVFLYAVWPQAAPAVTAYTVYSFECCVRAASVLGFIGAGGIGYEINVSMRLFNYGQVLTLVLAVIAIVAIADSFSKALRRRMNSNAPGRLLAKSPGEIPHARSHGFALRDRISVLIAAIGIVLSFYGAGFFTSELGDGGMAGRVWRFAANMIPPNFEVAFLRSLPLPLMQTIAISIIGTLIGIIIAGVLVIPATSTLILGDQYEERGSSSVKRFARQSIYVLARLALSVFRSIPEVVWVLMCIIAVGLGPFAGTLAIGLHTGGVLGKLYSEALEEAPGAPIEAMRALGARPSQLLLWAIWPQVRPTIISYTMLRWEMNLRVSTILGLVGGGGLGQLIYNTVQLGMYPKLTTLIILIYALVISADWITHRFRYSSVSLQVLSEHLQSEQQALRVA